MVAPLLWQFGEGSDSNSGQRRVDMQFATGIKFSIIRGLFGGGNETDD